MIKNRLIYLLTLVGVLVFYIFYYDWVSHYLFYAVLLLPLLSLLLSLPAMLTCRIQVDTPVEAEKNTEISAAVFAGCNRYIPGGYTKCRLHVQELTQGRHTRLSVLIAAGQAHTVSLSSIHCGCLELRFTSCRVFDYLGLFWLPVKKPLPVRTLIMPRPEAPKPEPDLTTLMCSSFRPKNGGGYSEVHEVREYRPGDNLRDVHWKLSAKADKLMLREAMEPSMAQNILLVVFSADPCKNDRATARLRYVAEELLYQGIRFSIRYIHPESGLVETHPIATQEDLLSCLRRLLTLPLCQAEPSAQASAEDADWFVRLDGEEAEA